MKQFGTDEKVVKQTEQRETGDLKVRVKKLRAEGKTYRDIARQERISIAQISRILKQPTESEAGVKPQTSSVDLDREEASTVFEQFERGKSLPRIVIDHKISPDKLRQRYDEYVDLMKIDLNQPIVPEKIKELEKLLKGEICLSCRLTQLFAQLFQQAKDIGEFKLRNCSYVNARGFCTNWHWENEGGSKYNRLADALRCAFCFNFNRI